MPDGDKIHKNLRFFYQNAYKQLCETPFEPEGVSREILRAMRKSVKYDGGGHPFRVLEKTGARLDALPQEPLARRLVDWAEEGCVLEQLAHEPRLKKRVAALVLNTSKNVLHDLRNGRQVQKDLPLELHNRYFTNLYRAEFEERIPLATHYNGVSQEIIESRLESIRPYIISGLEKFAAQKRRDASGPLRLPKRTEAAKPILLHETNLLGEL